MTGEARDFDQILTEILVESLLAVGVLRDQRLVHANPGCRVLLGLDSPAEPPALWSLALESEQARVRERLEDFCRQDETALSLSFPVTRRDGVTVHLELHAVPARLPGRYRGDPVRQHRTPPA